jgi:DNA-directed RNA polymerase subunit RPC12/RpoP
MAHTVFIRHTYIYKCGETACREEWKINEASDLDKLRCPHCGNYDSVRYVDEDQRTKYNRKGMGL